MKDDILYPAPSAPASGATVTLLDNSSASTATTIRSERRAMVMLYTDKAGTVVYNVRARGGQWRAANGAGDAVSANTLFLKDYILQGDDQQILFVQGGGGNTATWECSVRGVPDRAAAV